jgi:uncharacterized protein YoxC
MASEYGPSLAELDEVLSKAIERQIAEQRALRQALEDLRESVRRVAERPQATPSIDVIGISDNVRDSVRLAIDTGVGRLEKSVRDIRAELGPQLEDATLTGRNLGALRDDVRAVGDGVREDVRSVADALGGVAADVRGMAQALIDLNAGLRGWADGVDEGIGTITDSLATIRKLSDARPSSSAAVPVDEAGVAAIRDQLKETADLSLYLTDQIEDLDAVLNKLGELPERVEGVVTQAMRRTLTARAKIEQEAGSVLDDVASSLDGTVERLVEALGVLEGGDVRRLALAQVELTSRVESMQDTLQSRIDGIELGYRQMLEALARAIDRSSRGQEPRALEAVAKAVVPRPSRKPAVKKATKSTRGKRKRTAARRAEPTE